MSPRDFDFHDRLAGRAALVGVHVSSAQADKLRVYWDLLERWNARMNLTAVPLRGFRPESIDRLLIEPIAASTLVESADCVWYDLGSGGGSPAIPLKIMCPETTLTMVEARSRKAAFLREAVRTLDLSSTTVEARRFEDVAADPLRTRADFLTARAVRADLTLATTCMGLLKSGGRALLFVSETSGTAAETSGFTCLHKIRASSSASIHVVVPRGTS